MKKWTSFLAFLTLSFLLSPLNGAQFSPQDMAGDLKKPATIKVLLNREIDGILLEIRGGFEVINPENGKRLSSGRKGKRFYLYPHKEGIKWGENFLGIFQLQIVPTHPATTFSINGIQYRGALEIYHIKEKLNLINEIDVESFLKATLPRKIIHSHAPAVIDAMAIITRTDLYHKALTHKSAFWHVVAEDYHYQGLGLTLQELEIERAIDNTRHLVMTYEEQPFPATWTAHCGGKTANYQDIFRKTILAPSGIESAFAAQDRTNSYWKLVTDNQEIAKIAKINRVTGIDLFVDHQSGKVYAIRIYDGPHTQTIDFETFQTYLGEDNLCSNDFNVTIKGNIVTFEGYGQGNGVGLCLYSANNLSERGDEAPQILAEFFPYTHLEKMRCYPKMISLSKEGKEGFAREKTDKTYKLLHR